MPHQRPLHDRLARLRCPSFLLDGSERTSSVAAGAYRRPLLLWLFAVYRSPELRFSTDESWTRVEPSADELEQWLRLAGVQDPSLLVDGVMAPERASVQLLRVVDFVERGAAACVNETIQLLEDIATHADSFFDSRCEIFPVSIQLVAADTRGGAGGLTSQQLSVDIEFIDQQAEGLEGRINSARERLRALAGPTGESDASASKALSQELGRCFDDAVALMDRSRAMLSEDISCWSAGAAPQLIGLGPAAVDACQRVDRVLALLESTELAAKLSRDGQSLQKAREVTSYGHSVAHRLAPDVRRQLATLEAAETSP